MSTTRYGESLYGTPGLTYGAATVTRKVTWGVQVDWDEDGTFSGENEAAYMDGATLKGRLLSLRKRMGREFVFISSGDGFDHPRTAQLELELLNLDGRYDPYNADSPLYGYLYKNQKVQVIARDETNSANYYAFTGYISDVRPNYGSINTATIYADGAEVKLNTPVTASAVSTNVEYHDQISAALTAAAWAGGTSIDDTVTDTMAYHWLSGRDAIDEINDISDAAFGLFWVDEEGIANYLSRVSGDISTQTLTEADIDYSYGIQTPSPREILKNKVRVYVRARTSQASVEIWRMSDKPQITGTGNPIWATFNYNGETVPATSVTAPVATTDYTANDNQDGSGTNRTANFSFATTTFATSAKLIPTNSGAAAYITLLKLRGTVITADEYTYMESEDATSISTYGERLLVIKTDWLQNTNIATETADTLVSKFASPRAYPRFKIKRSEIGKQFTTGLFNLLTVNFASRAITGEFRVGFIEQSWNISEPNVIDTVVYCEPNLSVASGATWVFPTSFPTIFP